MFQYSENYNYDLNEILNINEENNLTLFNNNRNFIFQGLNSDSNDENKDSLDLNGNNSEFSPINQTNEKRQIYYNNISDINIYKKNNNQIFNITHKKRKPLFHIDLINNNKNKENKISLQNENDNKINNIRLEEFKKENRKNNSLSNKAKEYSQKNKHNKYSDDNLRKKCKHLVLNSVMEFLNKKIFDLYEGNIGNNTYRKEILTLNKSQKTNSNIEFNRSLYNKKISEIFSENISTRYTNYLPQHNKLLIERLKNEEDENKNKYFNNILDLTFKDCLNHFIGKTFIEELDGMKRFENLLDSLDDDKEYINILKYYLENFENILNNKNPRKTKKSKKEKAQIENEMFV